MRKVISKETTFCDKCGEETYVTKCLNCGKEHCYKCREREGIEYKHSTHFSGSGDGYYCNNCDAELRKTKTDELHSAYVTIQNLRMESELFYKDWERRAKFAEIQIEELRRKPAKVSV